MARLNIRFLNAESDEEAVKIFHGGDPCICPRRSYEEPETVSCRAAKTWRTVNELGQCYMCGNDHPSHVQVLKERYVCVS